MKHSLHTNFTTFEYFFHIVIMHCIFHQVLPDRHRGSANCHDSEKDKNKSSVNKGVNTIICLITIFLSLFLSKKLELLLFMLNITNKL